MPNTLPTTASRILIAGTSGSGKTTLAAEISQFAGIEHIEIDALFHGPGWQRRPSSVADVEAFSSQPAWITEWQYSEVRPLLADRADTVIWLDYPRWFVMTRVIRRTIRRAVYREMLWNGNREAGLLYALTSREGIINWAWTTYPRNRKMISSLRVTHPNLSFIHLRSARETRQWSEQSRRAWSRQSS